MNDILKIIKPLEDLGVLIDGVTETVKSEIKKQEGGFYGVLLAPLASSLVQPVIYSVVKGITRRGVRIAGRDLDDENSKRTHWVIVSSSSSEVGIKICAIIVEIKNWKLIRKKKKKKKHDKIVL